MKGTDMAERDWGCSFFPLDSVVREPLFVVGLIFFFGMLCYAFPSLVFFGGLLW